MIRHLRWLIGLASIAIAVLYLWGLGEIGFLEAEGMYAEIAREMLASGDWVIPRFNGVPYVEKPPLMYWLTAGTYAVLGTSEFSARLWKVIPTLATFLLTYGLGRRLFSDGVGFLSALLLATTLGSFLFSRITQMDSLLVFGIALSVLGIVGAGGSDPERTGNSGWRPAVCFWTGITIGVMSKGLPGLLFPLALLALWAMIHKDTGAIRGMCHWAVVPLALALIVPWHVAAATKVPGFLEFYVLDNQLLRFLGERNYVEDNSPLGTLAFLGVTVLALFPWAPYLAAALMAHGVRLKTRGVRSSRFNVQRSSFNGQQRTSVGMYERSHETHSPLGSYFRTFVGSWACSVFSPQAASRKPQSVAPRTSNLEPCTSNDSFRNPQSAIRNEIVSPFTPHASRVWFLVGWIALVVGFFVFSSFKLEYYALPAFPAVALLVAAFLASVDHAGKSGTSLKQNHPGASQVRHQMPLRVLRGWTWVALVGGLLFSSAAATAWGVGLFTPQNIVRALSIWTTSYRVMLEEGLPLPPVSPGYFSALLLGGGLMWTAGFAAALGWLRRGQVLAATLVVALVGVGLSAMAASVLRQVESHHSLKPLAERLNGAIRPEDVVVHERDLEKGGGLLFYIGRQVLVLNGTRGDLEFGSRLPEHQRAFISISRFQDLWGGGLRVFLVTDLPQGRSAISMVTQPSPVLVASTGTRWLYSNRQP